MSDAIMTMSALAQPTRLRVATTLAGVFPKGLPVTELAARVDTPQNTMSGHLAILLRAGLVATHRIGRIVEYRAEPKTLRSLAEYLLDHAPAEA